MKTQIFFCKLKTFGYLLCTSVVGAKWQVV